MVYVIKGPVRLRQLIVRVNYRNRRTLGTPLIVFFLIRLVGNNDR